MFQRLADQYRQFTCDLIINLQALALVLQRRGYAASCYTCGEGLTSASFIVSLAPKHIIRFLVSDCGISWTELKDDRELMKLEGAEAIEQIQELAEQVKRDLSLKVPAPTYVSISR